MKKYSILLLSSATLIFFAIGFSSCKDDDPVKYSLSFSKTTDTAIESDATIEIEIKLDKPAPEDITIDYELSGTALDNIRATSNQSIDFVIDGDYGEIEIEKGATTATITLVPFSDDLLEDDETIIVNFSDVDNANVSFEESAKTTVTLDQENGIVVLLEWPAASTSGVADLDMLVRIAKTAANPDWDGILTGSVYRGFEGDYEFVFLPNTYTGELFDLDYTDTTYGLTYTYYDGTLDPLDFTVTFIDFIDGDLEPEAEQQIFEQSYTLANLNKWVNVTGGLPTIIAQTFRNNDGVFSDISEVTVQETSSRVVSSSANQIIEKQGIQKMLDFNNLPLKLKNRLTRN